jgi:hypothetical protein
MVPGEARIDDDVVLARKVSVVGIGDGEKEHAASERCRVLNQFFKFYG